MMPPGTFFHSDASCRTSAVRIQEEYFVSWYKNARATQMCNFYAQSRVEVSARLPVESLKTKPGPLKYQEFAGCCPTSFSLLKSCDKPKFIGHLATDPSYGSAFANWTVCSRIGNNSRF
jgi:hypothetical protein